MNAAFSFLAGNQLFFASLARVSRGREKKKKIALEEEAKRFSRRPVPNLKLELYSHNWRIPATKKLKNSTNYVHL